jgi:predicted nucleic acid-binding Zn ribbon protein
VLQKLSDPVLETCPACGQNAYRKQVTAAGFQLKGSGWYVTDFRGGKTATADAKPDAAGAANGDKTDAKTDAKSDTKADAPKTESAAASTSTQPPAASTTP